MRIYFIKVPYVSSGLKRSYCKQLEVYSGQLDETRENLQTVFCDWVYKYHVGKDVWVERECNGKEHVRMYTDVVPHSNMPSLDQIARNPTFISLEAAQAAKLVLVQRMAKEYEDELERLKTLFAKNVPDVNKPLKSLKADYPEYFI